MEYKIFVGTSIKIKKGFMKGVSRIMYCGMSDKSTFVLAPLIAYGYQGFSPNVFYNINSLVIQIHDKTFDVIEVNHEYIVLRD